MNLTSNVNLQPRKVNRDKLLNYSIIGTNEHAQLIGSNQHAGWSVHIHFGITVCAPRELTTARSLRMQSVTP
jgi:hypothetical protein